MIPEALTCTAVLGLDVGKTARWACCVTRPGEVVANRRVANAEKDLDELSSQMAAGTLVVVDQCRNIGALALARARAARLPRPRPPGLVLRHSAEEPPVGHLHIVGPRVQAGQQEAEEPAHILVQQPGQEQ